MQKVFEYIRQYHMINAGEKVVVGVSGGADSLCLLFVLKEYMRQVDFDMMVVHVEHGIRGQESLEDAAFVEQICQKEGLPYRCVSCLVPEIAGREGLGLEEAARKVRYEAFEQIKSEFGADKVAVAHNKNDQAETMLFQMVRGSGLKGACGISPVRGCIIRPLLDVTREEIEGYLKGRKLTWRTDSTNHDLEYTRNCLRHRILPELISEVNTKSVEHLALLGEELRRVQEYMETSAEAAAEGFIKKENNGITVDIDEFRQQPEVLRGYLLKEALRRDGCSLKDITRKHITQMEQLTEGQSGRQMDLPGGWAAGREFGKLRIWKKTEEDIFREIVRPEIPGETVLKGESYVFRVFPYCGENIPQKIYTKWFDYDKIGSDLVLRTRQPGDFLTVDSRGSRKKLKSYFIEEKISLRERRNVLLLAKGSEIIWVTGHRISETYKVSDQTKKILEVRRIGKNDGREN